MKLLHLPLVMLTLGLAATASAQREKLGELPPEDKARRFEQERAAWPKLQAAYFEVVQKARADLDKARESYQKTKDAHTYQAAIHQHNWAITSKSALGDIARSFSNQHALLLPLEGGKPKWTLSEAYAQNCYERFHWYEAHVWGNLAQPVVPFAQIDRSYLQKKNLRLVMAGDSITMYMAPHTSMNDYLDERFEILTDGLAGHSVTNWFTAKRTQAVRDWNPDLIVLMLGTNGTSGAMNDDRGKKGREELMKQFASDLQSLRDLPSKPQVVVVSVPAQAPGFPFTGMPAMWELQSHVAREHGFPFIDMARGLAMQMSECPTGFTWTPNRKTVGKWSHAFDDAHCSTGPAKAKYYGLVCRQILEPARWFNLNLRCSAQEDEALKEPWLLAQAIRSAVPNQSLAKGVDAKEDNGKWTFVDIEAKLEKPAANGEVSFLLRGKGADFYLMPGRDTTLTFGRPYQIRSDTPPQGTFPERYTIHGTLLRGDNQPANGVPVTLGDAKATTNAQGQFRFESLTGNIVDTPLVIKMP